MLMTRKARERYHPLLKPAGVLLIAFACLLITAGLRVFSYLALQLTAPFSPANGQGGGFPRTIRDIEGFFDSAVWLAPLLFIAGLVALGLSRPSSETEVSPVSRNLWPDWVALGLLLATFLLRLTHLLRGDWLQIRADYDEGVHMMASHLFLSGVFPYRDYFFAQPPAAIYGLLPAALFGGNGPALIWLARFSSVIWCAGCGWFAWLIARRMGGVLVGWVALLVLELDGIGLFIGHQALLEWQLNFFSLLALWAFLRQFDASPPRPHYTEDSGWGRKFRRYLSGERWLWVSGIALGVACLTKLNGVLLVLAICAYLLLFRRTGMALRLVLVTGGAALFLALPALVTGGWEVLKQAVFFQLLREPDGIGKADRFNSFAFDPRPYTVSGNSSLTMLLVCAGVGGWLFLWWRGNRAKGLQPWLLLSLWAVFTLLFFSFSSTFFVHYYVMLLPVLAFAAGGVGVWLDLIRRRFRPVALFCAAVFILLCLPAAVTQVSSLFDRGLSPAPQQIASFIENVSTPGTTVQSFDAIYNLAAGYPLPSTSSGRLLVDSYGGLQYEAFGGRGKGLTALVKDFVGGKRISANHTFVQNTPAAQEFLQELFVSAGLIVLDERGRDYTAPATEATLGTYAVTLVQNQILTGYSNVLVGSKQAAREWVARNLPRGAKIWVEPGSTYLSGAFQVAVGQDTWRYPPDWFRQQGFSYLLLSSETFGRFFQEPGRFKEQVNGYNNLVAEGHLASFIEGSTSSAPLPLGPEKGRLALVRVPGSPEPLSLPEQKSGALFGPAMRLDGFALAANTTPGHTLPVSLNFTRLNSSGNNLQEIKLFLHLLDEQGNTVAQRDTYLEVGSLRAASWPAGREMLVDGDLDLPANLKPGRYRLELGLYTDTSGARLPVTPLSDAPSDHLELGPVDLTS